MNKKLLIGIAIVAVVAGGALYMVFAPEKDEAVTPVDVKGEDTATPAIYDSNRIYTPEEVLELGEELDGKTIQIRGNFSMIPFVDSFGLGGAGPGFETDSDNITMNNPASLANKNIGAEVVVRGEYDSDKQYLFIPPQCSDCVLTPTPTQVPESAPSPTPTPITPKTGDIEEIQTLLNEEEWVRVIVTLEGNEFTTPEFISDDVKKKSEVKKIQDAVLITLTENDFQISHQYQFITTFAGMVSKSGMEKLLANPRVTHIQIDKPVPAN